MLQRLKKALTHPPAREMLVEVKGGSTYRNAVGRGEVIWKRRMIGNSPYEVIDKVFSTYLNLPKTPCGNSIPKTGHEVLVILIDGKPLEEFLQSTTHPQRR